MIMYYKLDGHEVVPCADVLEWGRWFECHDRRVAHTEVGNVRISTVFIGIGNLFMEEGLVFETIVFGGPLDSEQDKYATWNEALEGHAQMVRKVRDSRRIRARLHRLVDKIKSLAG